MKTSSISPSLVSKETNQGFHKNKLDPQVFQRTLKQALNTKSKKPSLESGTQNLKFSQHALMRMQARGLKMDAHRMEQIQTAVDKAELKGSKETLVISGEDAFIVNVKNKTVITAVDKNALKEGVITNIDSTVFA